MTILFFWYVLGWVAIDILAEEFGELTIADCIIAMGLWPLLALCVVIGVLPWNLVYEWLKKCDHFILWRKQ